MRHHTGLGSARFVLLVTTVQLGLACSSASPPEKSTGGGASGDGTGGSSPTSSGSDGGASVGTPGNPGSTEDAGTTGATGPSGDASSPAVDAGPLPVVITYVSGATVSTLAGSDAAGTQDGTGAAAQFDNPAGVAIDATTGNLVVTDYDSGHVRLVTPAGVVTTLAMGTGFVDPFSVAVSTDGKYYVGTDANSSGVKDTMTGTIWLVPPSSGSPAMPTVVAENFARPRSLAPITAGNLFVADRDQNVVEVVTVSGGQASVLAGTSGATGFTNATGASALFNGPVGAAAMPDGSFVVTDAGNNVIRRVTAGGVVTTFAGNGAATLVDGPCASASFNQARGVAVDAAGNVYVSDIGNQVIRRISVGCTVQTLAGNGTMGFADGAGNAAAFYGQEGIAVTPDGSTVYVADGNGGDGSAHHRIRAIAVPSGI